MAVIPIKTIDWDLPNNDFDQVYTLEVGDVFKFTKNQQTLELKIDERKPNTLSSFEVLYITPGTELYTLYQENHMVVVKKVAV
jgi:hypothetical protein